MIISPFILIYGIYILFNGHLTPGGGFSGGAILGSAISLYAITFGAAKVRTIFSFKTLLLSIGIALLFYALVKGYAFIMGASELSTGIPLGTPGNLFSGGLILPLNISVGIVVASTVYGLYALFSEGEV
jgi:multicomponent Na+:H+ antiporter subunit B